MKKSIPTILNVLVLIALLLGLVGMQTAAARPEPRPEVIYPERTDTSEPLHTRPQLPPQAGRTDLPRKVIADRINSPEPIPAIDPALDGNPSPEAGTTFLNFEGISNRNGVLPPDTVGDIGPNHYVQMVNLSLQIWSINRATNTATTVYGPVNGNAIWSGFGGACQTENDGDPIVLYDQAADRWLVSQFALPNYPSGPFYQCIAISETPDPTGAWHRYSYVVSNTKMNDYPHLGVWPDGYYMTVNQFSGSLGWAGAGVVAFERDKMLLGQTARMVYFDMYNVDPKLGGMLPADLDGTTPPPAGSPNIILQVNDNTWGYPNDQIEYWNFHVDWSNPANSTMTQGGLLTTAAFDSNMCGGSRSCIPQPGTTTKLDAISDRVMFRLAYRNFGTHQVLLANHTVDATGGDRAGVRWYELRKITGGNWGIYQQGTYSPDTTHRWMASIAMNGAGQIALGYAASSSTLYPSIRYTGRLPGDALNTMTQGDNVIIAGTGNQTHAASRWGDYSAMSVDPTDDCTFWYTQEYIATSGSANWRTRIASFQFPGCVAGDTPPTVSITAPAAGATVSGTVNVTANASDDHGVTNVEFKVDGMSIGVDTTAPYQASWITTAASEGSHTLSATATDTIGQTASDPRSVTVDNVQDPVLTLHVGDLDGTKTLARNNWKATVTVTVHDASHALVSGAVVSFTWSGGISGSGSCTTGAAGTCSVTSANIKNTKPSVTFTVTNLTKSGYSYLSTANHETAITILK